MKFLMVSKCGEGAHLLHKIGEEGNEVKLFVQEEDYRSIWSGILEQVSLGSNWIDKSTVIIFDQSGMGSTADRLKKYGHKVFGGSSWADKLEHNREYGLAVMERCGIDTPESLHFIKSEWNDAIDEIRKNKNIRYVFKPSGCDLPSKLTYCPCDSEDLLGYIDFIRQHFSKEIESFVLQEFIEGHIVSTEAWCDGKKFVRPFNHTVEVKKLMNDDLGPSTGCSGNLVWPAEMDSICLQGVSCIEEMCVKEGYIGPIDLNTIVNEEGVYGLEWTPRFGYDAMPTLLQLLDCEISKIISDCAQGKGSMNLCEGFAGGIRLTIPPYPLEPPKAKDVQKDSPNKGIPIRGLPTKYKENYYFYEIMAGSNDEFVHSDGTGAILVASDLADSAKSAFDLPYEILENVKIPDKQYRTDLDKVLPKMYDEIVSYEESLCQT